MLNIAFVSTMESVPWGGSEELWSRTARHLLAQGHRVSASVRGWDTVPAQLTELSQAGMKLHSRTYAYRLNNMLKNRLLEREITAIIQSRPDLVVISHGYHTQGYEWMETCRRVGIPYIILVQAAGDHDWPDDYWAKRLAEVYDAASMVCFVSNGNMQLAQSQFGAKLQNARVVWNPVNVAARSPISWPATETAMFAMVGRLHPPAKGQDLVFQALTSPEWRRRDFMVNIFGSGPSIETLTRLKEILELDRVCFKGHVADVDGIWQSHHCLLMPSRFEGLPLTVVEAMLCGRPTMVTDVAGNAELIVDNETGFVAPGASVRSVNEAMNRMWDRRDDWEQMGLCAAEAIRNCYPTDPVSDFAALIQTVVAETKGH